MIPPAARVAFCLRPLARNAEVYTAMLSRFSGIGHRP
jgi:hypothetical protein